MTTGFISVMRPGSRRGQRHFGRMLRLFVALVIVGLLLSLFTSWVLDIYDTSWHPKRSLQQSGDESMKRKSGPPYPGVQLENMFWFVQVRGEFLLSIKLLVARGHNNVSYQRFVLSIADHVIDCQMAFILWSVIIKYYLHNRYVGLIKK